jgi:ketosteroid isomerase-like protein
MLGGAGRRAALKFDARAPISHRMDQARVELLREFYEALNRDDFDSAVKLCDPDVRVWLNPDVVAALPPRGHKEVANYLRGWFDSWDTYVARPQEFIEAGEQMVVMVQLRARGKGSRFEIEEEMADVFTLDDGHIVELRLYVDRGVALESAGVERGQ